MCGRKRFGQAHAPAAGALAAGEARAERAGLNAEIEFAAAVYATAHAVFANQFAADLRLVPQEADIDGKIHGSDLKMRTPCDAPVIPDQVREGRRTGVVVG